MVEYLWRYSTISEWNFWKITLPFDFKSKCPDFLAKWSAPSVSNETCLSMLTCILLNLPAELPVDQAALQDSVLIFESHFVLLMSCSYKWRLNFSQATKYEGGGLNIALPKHGILGSCSNCSAFCLVLFLLQITISINLLVFYHKCCNLIGYATHSLFHDR